MFKFTESLEEAVASMCKSQDGSNYEYPFKEIISDEVEWILGVNSVTKIDSDMVNQIHYNLSYWKDPTEAVPEPVIINFPELTIKKVISYNEGEAYDELEVSWKNLLKIQESSSEEEVLVFLRNWYDQFLELKPLPRYNNRIALLLVNVISSITKQKYVINAV